MADGVCGSCGARGAEFACSRCKSARFCGQECFRAAWKAHKLRCFPAPSMGVSQTPPASAAKKTVAAEVPKQLSRTLSTMAPDCLEVINAGKCGRGLASKHCFSAGQEIAREFCLAWASGPSPPTPRVMSVAEAPIDAAEEFAGLAPVQESACLVIADMLLRRWECVQNADAGDRMRCVEELCTGPQHWLELPEMRRALENRCATVQSVLAEGRRQGRWTLHQSNADVMDMDLRRIGSNVTTSNTPGCQVPFVFSLLNHSCSPNAVLQWHGAEAVLVCLRPIKAGEEVCISYVNECEGVLSRRYFLLRQQGFLCLCARCQANFCGAGEDVLEGWLCHNCNSNLREEAIRCPSCNMAVSNIVRSQRQMRNDHACQLVNRAVESARTTNSGQALALLRQSVQELQAIRPTGSKLIVSAMSMLRSCLLQTCALSDADAVASKLAEQKAAQRTSFAAEAAAVAALMPQSTATSNGDIWARRLVAALRLYKPTEVALQHGRKRRVGPPTDGGYVVWDSGMPLCDVLLSYGVDTNVDFEAELAAAGAQVLMFDHTVPGPPRHHPNFVFKREALADEVVEGVAGTLSSHIANHEGRVMLKCDVEGAEFGALLATPQEVLDRFEQICIELHWIGRPSRGGNFRSKALALERLNEQFVLVHVHGNSYGDVMEIAGCHVPDVLEALYVNRRLLKCCDVQPSSSGIPDSALDVNNCTFLRDIALSGAPFGADIP
eukprot:TRINITY_DN107417_c0_g1_i1.p1 TRINITY_DN107417_c0_g1~~TRINITY_DN107417_c0_g1_i1.p1  ORF type:complete len:723 (+),score=112.05 TRINITY_DN107417_c0_g1_i1:45-2213(+)